jgi:hypothetical protein
MLPPLLPPLLLEGELMLPPDELPLLLEGELYEPLEGEELLLLVLGVAEEPPPLGVVLGVALGLGLLAGVYPPCEGLGLVFGLAEGVLGLVDGVVLSGLFPHAELFGLVGLTVLFAGALVFGVGREGLATDGLLFTEGFAVGVVGLALPITTGLLLSTFTGLVLLAAGAGVIPVKLLRFLSLFADIFLSESPFPTKASALTLSFITTGLSTVFIPSGLVDVVRPP